MCSLSAYLLAHDGHGTSPQTLHPLLFVDFRRVAHHACKTKKTKKILKKKKYFQRVAHHA
jgi:hypothetical protein